MMKPYILFLLCCAATATLHAQGRTGSLWNDTSWSATGSQTNEEYGVTLSYLGAFDSASNALAIGESGGSSWILNKKRLDTQTVLFSKGNHIYPCNLSGTGRGDYVIYDGAQTFWVLYATDTPLVFDTVLIIRGQDYNYTRPFSLIADLDSSGTESLYICEFRQPILQNPDTLRIIQFTGGSVMDTTPYVYAVAPYNWGGDFTIGNVRDTKRQYLCSLNPINNDSAIIYFNPLGKGFSFIPTDSIICNTASAGGGFGGVFFLDDVDDDSIQDILIGWNSKVLIYKGGDSISSLPTYYFADAAAFDFAAKSMIDIGNAVSSQYRTLLVTYPGYGGQLLVNPGAIFLFNIGKGLDSNCAAYAIEGVGTDAYLGTSTIGIGKYLGDTLDGYMVSESAIGTTDNQGEVFAFKGNSKYGTSSVIRTGILPPQIFSLSQNYPNPVTGTTTIMFSVLEPALVGDEVTLKLYDALGRFVRTLFRSKAADGYEYTIGVSTAGLAEGNYFYRLSAGGKETARMMSVMK